MNSMQDHLKFPLAFGIFMGEKNHKSGLITYLFVKHLLVYDWYLGKGINEFLFN